MKKFFAAALLSGAVAFSGCSDKEIHADQVRAAMQGLPDPQKTNLEIALSAIATNNYRAALKPLQNIAFGVKLDTNQSVVLRDTIKKVVAKAEKQK